ncbi:MAG: GTP-dependent dephospho-CoA kinase family protein [Halodesulfurarchaeum sp.]
MSTVVARLPPDARHHFKPALGPMYGDPARLLEDAGTPILTIGDVVSYHLANTGHVPKLVVVDGHTERETVDESVERGLPETDRTVRVENPQATVTKELVEAIQTALSADGATTVKVDGEEDLAVLPAMLVAPEGATVVYGQPGEGMVAVRVDSDARDAARDRLGHMEYDEDYWADLDVISS